MDRILRLHNRRRTLISLPRRLLRELKRPLLPLLTKDRLLVEEEEEEEEGDVEDEVEPEERDKDRGEGVMESGLGGEGEEDRDRRVVRPHRRRVGEMERVELELLVRTREVRRLRRRSK